MPATPMEFILTPEELRAAVDKAVRQRTGPDATPVFGDSPDYPRVWEINDLKNRPEAQWLIQNLVEEKGLCIFFGPDKVGKTAALSNFLWAWCAGHDDFLTKDFRMTGTDRTVLYVLLEGQANFYSRYDAWCHAYNEGKAIENFYVVDEGLSLFQREMEWEDPNTWTGSAMKLYQAIKTLRPDILVIDTLSRATAGMDENSSSMAHVVGMLDHLRDLFDLATVIVHHTSLAETDRPRGHSSLKGAASSYVRIEGKPDQHVLTLVTGPHRNSDAYTRTPFSRQSTRASFVVSRATAPVKVAKKDQLFALVEPTGSYHVAEAAQHIYGDPKATAKVRELARSHDQLTYQDGYVLLLTAEDAEEIE